MLLLEAGGDPEHCRATAGSRRRLPEDYEVPAFHPHGSENEAMSGISSSATMPTTRSRSATRNTARLTAAGDGVLYPRAGTLGGCTAHNAMIISIRTMRTGTTSPSSPAIHPGAAEHMRRYFERLENCRHRRP